MPMILFLVLVGTAAGLFATRLMKVQTDVLTAALIGIVGAGIGWMVLRFVLALSGWLIVTIAATLGAMGLIWLWKNVFR